MLSLEKLLMSVVGMLLTILWGYVKVDNNKVKKNCKDIREKFDRRLIDDYNKLENKIIAIDVKLDNKESKMTEHFDAIYLTLSNTREDIAEIKGFLKSKML